ncbi:DUF4870 domain-containing protein [Paenibacillus thalictri]|uniref:DUF4870 domain-containing protein n=1 Tax=Paenibacillus thalictri TaxID=2527873 RepID=A0A4Q9DIE1_9BACL|nr:hypothetical protein [Paenibacillus thalictri]TBL69940.1 hypothetical protein EYB31_34810 [Paenibacillus thalictri]
MVVMEPGRPFVDEADQADIDKNKGIAILSYIIFFIPLLAARDSKYAMYHANQGLLLFLAAIVINIVGAIIPLLGWLIITPIGNLAVLVFAVLGIINAAKGELKPLPLIGGIQILK